MARMLVIYHRPEDPAAFDRHYAEVHVPLAKQLPGLRRYDVSRGAVTGPHGSGVHMVATLTFDSVAAIKAAFASEAGAACAADRRHFAPDPARFQMLLYDESEV
jgi:uncharacterized protein (TIGR02118 family)